MFVSMSILVYEDPSLVTLAETREPGTTLGSPLLLLVHPHGIFSIGMLGLRISSFE